MTRPAKLAIAILVAAALSSCGREGTPTGPSGPTSFLTGTWRGTVTIQVNPGDPGCIVSISENPSPIIFPVGLGNLHMMQIVPGNHSMRCIQHRFCFFTVSPGFFGVDRKNRDNTKQAAGRQTIHAHLPAESA